MRETVAKIKTIKLTKEQLLIILLTVILAALSAFSENSKAENMNGIVERSGHGGTKKEYSILVEGIGDEKKELTFSISPQVYTKEEAFEKLESLSEELAFYILADNKDLKNITGDLNFSKTVSGYEGIKLTFTPKDTELISYDGIVNNSRLKENRETEINVKLKTGDYSKEIVLPVTVLPKPMSETERLLENLKEEIEAADENSRTEAIMNLPDEVENTKVTYSQKKEYTPVLILILGITAVVMLSLKPESDRKKAKKERETELLIDYSELVSKLIVYIGAGLTIRNAWIKIAESYREEKNFENTSSRALYEEVERTERELKNGISERKAYMDFAHRCGPKCYIRLASLLEQNRKTGDAGLIAALSLEMEEAFEQRKNTAKRLGEEAGTKLIVPLIISLVTVIIIVAVPALMSLN